jgi:hypothetical protein
MGNPPCWREEGGLTKEVDLILPLGDVAANEFRPFETVYEREAQTCKWNGVHTQKVLVPIGSPFERQGHQCIL